MKTILFAGTLALAAMPTSAQILDYGTLCAATEGTGDNNDFCTLWAQQNYQGMRNALTISIRTARAAENRNRFYFDHKRGHERGSFIQVRRPWMTPDAFGVTARGGVALQGDGWLVIQSERINLSLTGNRSGFRETTFYIENEDAGRSWVTLVESGYNAFQYAGLAHDRQSLDVTAGIRDDNYTSEEIRRFVECGLDEYGWQLGEVEVRPSIDDGNCPPYSRAGTGSAGIEARQAIEAATGHPLNGGEAR